MSIIPFVEMAAPRPPLGEASTWICWEGLSTKPPVGWDIARGKIFVKLQSACVQHIQLKAKSLCENMQLDMQSKRIFNVFPLVQIQHAVHSGMLMLSFTGDRHILVLYIRASYHSHIMETCTSLETTYTAVMKAEENSGRSSDKERSIWLITGWLFMDK